MDQGCIKGTVYVEEYMELNRARDWLKIQVLNYETSLPIFSSDITWCKHFSVLDSSFSDT